MIDWDDVRYFLAVARGGSVRAAAERVEVNHTTVLRRIAQLEERLGARMFEKLPSGYRLTDAGEEVLEFAEQMEASANRLETRVFGRDQGVRGLLRVTLTPILATHLLMPDFAEFARLHPEIEMEILCIAEPVNVTNREADVAVRVVYERNDLPPNLHGLPDRSCSAVSTSPAMCSLPGAPAASRAFAGSSSASMASRTGRARVRFASPRFLSGPRTPRRRSSPCGRGWG